MYNLCRRGLLPAALAALACTATAQSPPSAGPKPPPPDSGHARASVLPDPLDARASVPAVVYSSALGRYRRTAEVMAIPWREANDTVARIGGWRAYAREAQQPESPLPTPPGGHSGHRQP